MSMFEVVALGGSIIRTTASPALLVDLFAIGK